MRDTEEGSQASEKVVADEIFSRHIRIIFEPDSLIKSENVTSRESPVNKDLKSETFRTLRTL
jgi:hypothetical protein